MKLSIEIDANYEEPAAVIKTARMTAEINQIVDFINGTDTADAFIPGTRDGRVELLEQGVLIRLYAEDGKVFAKTENGIYQLRLRLYELEDRFGSEIMAVVIQAIACGVLGAGFAGASLIWEKDEWSLLKLCGLFSILCGKGALKKSTQG